jgi:hypothetical protein
MHDHEMEAENMCFLLLFLEKEEYIKARSAASKPLRTSQISRKLKLIKDPLQFALYSSFYHQLM